MKSNLTTDEEGNRRWYNEKRQLHRLDGPAVEWINGTKYWYINGIKHRLNNPARESNNGTNNGTKYWYINNKLHRTNGPAIEYSNGYKYWYLNDIRYSEEEYNAEIKNRQISLFCL